MKFRHFTIILALSFLLAPSCEEAAKPIPDYSEWLKPKPGDDENTDKPDDPDTPDVTTEELKLVKTNSTSACVAIEYKTALSSDIKVSYTGICWSADGRPSASGEHQRGPTYPGNDKVITQGISNIFLDYGKDYNFRIYAVTTTGDVLYSSTFTASLGSEPQAITFDWTSVYSSLLPSSVKVYSTTQKLNGRAFNAWYAIADLSAGDVELRVNVPSSAATVDAQAKADNSCLVLTNAGYFYDGRHVGIKAVGDGLGVSGNISSVRGSLRSGVSEYSEMYEVTRGAFGVDASGKASVVWAGSAGSFIKFYDRPLPSIKGEAKYPAVSDSNPCEPIQWNPLYAVSAGPVLLKNGKCPFDLTETSKTQSSDEFFLSNFEIIPYDIFSKTLTPDRTAVGVTADGEVILFICDGRYATSQGARIDELAMIMKGLGCVEALNLDGGGSTGMMLGEQHINDITTGGNRAVVSTIGFYRK